MEQVLLPLILLLWPLVTCRQGVSVMDTTYSLANYRYLDDSQSTWFFATFLANKAGSFLMKLPAGSTMAGMNLLCGLVISVTALLCYVSLRRYISAGTAFAGELLAISFCWCPPVILYNYLTYLLLTAACLLLLRAFHDRRRERLWYVLAGVCLGVNVTVRLSNAVQVLLIAAVWYGCLLEARQEKKPFAPLAAGRTGYCVLGFVIGFGSIYLVTALLYGPLAYAGMIPALLGSAGNVESYTMAGMLRATLDAYIASGRWLALLLVCTAMAAVMFALPLLQDKPSVYVKYAAFAGGMALVLRFFYGRGMFTVNYQDYWCMFSWGMQLVWLVLISSAAVMIRAGRYPEHTSERISGGELTDHPETDEGTDTDKSAGSYCAGNAAAACLCMLVVLVLPLGSNNYTFPVLNCMFVTAPLMLHILRIGLQGFLNIPGEEESTGNTGKSPARALRRGVYISVTGMAGMVIAAAMLQAGLFHVRFAFRDGTDGTRRSAQITENEIARGMWTTPENAADITDLTLFLQQKSLTGRQALIFGNAPGIHYLCELPPAIDTTWPDLDSYPAGDFAAALEALGMKAEEGGGLPLVILHHEEQSQSASSDQKMRLLQEFMEQNGYKLSGTAGSYDIYEA